VKGDFAPFHRKIGISLELTGQTAEAERAYRRCLELDRRDMHTHQDLAIMIAIKGVRLTSSSSFRRRSLLLHGTLVHTPRACEDADRGGAGELGVQARVRDAIRHIKAVDEYHQDVFLPYFLGCVVSRADSACPTLCGSRRQLRRQRRTCGIGGRYLLLMAGPDNLREAHHNLRLAVQNRRPMWASCNHLLTVTRWVRP